MNSKVWIKKATSMCLMVAMVATYSMVALASDGKASGELIVNGNNVVTVNGEAAKCGRTIFTSSMISTPESTNAIINLGKAGLIELAPNSSMTVTFDSDTVSANLASGKITVLKSNQSVNVTAMGTSYSLVAGESASAMAKKDDDDDEKKGGAWWLWALVFGGAAAGILIAATANDDRQLGGGGTVVSPSR